MSEKKKKEETTDPVVDAKIEQVSKELDELLAKNNMALQPFLVYTRFGLVPRIQIVALEDKEDAEDN